MLTIHQRAGEDGKLFGSVDRERDRRRDPAARDLKVEKKKIHLDEPIREVGTYMVEIELAGGTPRASRRSSPKPPRSPSLQLRDDDR